jgi:membrane-associated phospholipid phosphatase
MVTLRKPWLVGLLALAVVVYVSTWLGWSMPWAWVVSADDAALAATHRFGLAHPAWIASWDVLCTAFSPLTFRVLTLGLVVWALMRGQRRLALFLFVSVELSAVLTELAKAAANRPRPATAMVVATSTSFPSGHALGTMVAVLALLLIALPLVRPTFRRWLIGAGVAIVLAVGTGRVMLNVHNPSDVVAGWALGYVYFVGCLLLLVPRRVKAAVETPAALGSAP